MLEGGALPGFGDASFGWTHMLLGIMGRSSFHMIDTSSAIIIIIFVNRRFEEPE